MADKNPLAVAARPVAPKPRVTARSVPKAAAARVATVEMAGVTVVALPAVRQASPAMPGAHALKAANSAPKDAPTTAPMAVAAWVKANPAPTPFATPVCVATALRSATSPVAQPVRRVSPTHCAPASTPWPTAGVTAATATAVALVAVDVARVHLPVVAAGVARPTRCAPASGASNKTRGDRCQHTPTPFNAGLPKRPLCKHACTRDLDLVWRAPIS